MRPMGDKARVLLALGLVTAAVALAQTVGTDARASASSSNAPLVDIYIRGVVGGRVAGKNAAHVEIRWDYKCLGDRLGAATYDWTLKLVRRLPRPEQTRTVMSGTSKTGTTRVQLAAGRYEPLADPFRCQTDRGAGSTSPEVGQVFVVPDFCSWTVQSLRGLVRLEQRGAVKALVKGGAVRPGETVVGGRRAVVTLASRGGRSSLRLAGGPRVQVDPRHCGARGGWKLLVTAGSLSARLNEADVRSPYEIQTANALTRSGRASWTVEARTRAGKPWTRVRASSGRVTVRPLRGGRSVVLTAGKQTVVSGA